ncbi:MAG TPA: DNA polymerase III subunit beta [Blastocatellia bacterium]|nr:DNA polymerase III subunit beta [Blastocatellia bacterium]
MEFSVGRARLLAELNLLQGVVERKNTIPILTNVLIEAVAPSPGTEGSKIKLLATDLDVSIETECVADVAKAGSVVIQARKIFDIVRSLPDSDIAFVKEENEWVKITCGASRFRVVGQLKEHFPSIVKQTTPGMLLPAAALYKLIVRTIFAITQEESRYALSGALFLVAGNAVSMVTTDGHRLSFVTCGLDSQDGGEATPEHDARVIVPKKALTELQRLTMGSEDAIEFAKDENHLFFKIGYRQLTSRLLSGQFPNYEMVIPKNNDKKVAINVEKIAQAVRRAALMADDRSHGIKMEFDDGRLVITSQTADLGESKEEVAIDYKEAKLAVRFNALYVLDFLNVVDGEDITLELKDDQSAVLFKPAEQGNCEFKYVIMPMRL